MTSEPTMAYYSGPRGMDYVAEKTPFDIVVDVLNSVAQDPQSRDRIAQASLFSHGESAWVSESAWHAGHRGIHVAREATTGGSPRTDLVVAGAAVEFKSTFGVWAFDARANSERERWLGPDVEKLRKCSVPALMVITVAALGGATYHQRPRYKVDWDLKLPSVGDLTPIQILETGVIAAERFLAPRCVAVDRVSFELGHVPAGRGQVHLAAVVGAVNPEAMTY